MAASVPTALVAPFTEENPQTRDQDMDQTQTPQTPAPQTQTQSDLSLVDLLMKTLLELVQTDTDPELDTFLLFLKAGYPQIPESKLRGASRPTIVQILLQYDRPNAISSTLRILRTMGKNQLANTLSRDSGIPG